MIKAVTLSAAKRLNSAPLAFWTNCRQPITLHYFFPLISNCFRWRRNVHFYNKSLTNLVQNVWFAFWILANVESRYVFNAALHLRSNPSWKKTPQDWVALNARIVCGSFMRIKAKTAGRDCIGRILNIKFACKVLHVIYSICTCFFLIYLFIISWFKL